MDCYAADLDWSRIRDLLPVVQCVLLLAVLH